MKTTSLLLTVLLVGCGQQSVSTVTEAPDLPRHELIFSHHVDAARTDYDIWRICADGSQLASLVSAPGQQLQASISPDGEAFVYAEKAADGARDVMQKSFGRGDAVNLTRHPADDSQPAWSPDGARIAFFSNRDAEKLELYLMDADGGNVSRLTENVYYDSGAAWSPDSRRIIFTRYFPAPDGSDHQGNGEVIMLDVASGMETQLTTLGGYNGGVGFSPDGRFITWHRAVDDHAEIWMMNADGSEQHAVTDTFIDEWSPEWSPDGNWIAFSAGVGSDNHGTFDLWLMRPDGSHRIMVSGAANTQAWHRWRPGEHYCR